MSEPLTARRIFDAISAQSRLKAEFFYTCLKILNVSVDNDPWPFERVTFDEYDASFELKKCVNELRITEDQARQLFSMGFERFWLNHLSGGETYYVMVDGTLVERHKE